VVARTLLDAFRTVAARVVGDCGRIEALASRAGIAVPSEAIERAAAAFGPQREPEPVAVAEAWVGALSASPAALARWSRVRLVREALLAALSSEDVARWFARRRADYDAALLSVLTLATEADAWLARTAAERDPDGFDDLAWSRTQADPTMPPGGALGWRLRRDLPAIVAEAVFGAARTGLTDPVLSDGVFQVHRVWRVRPARRTAVVEAACRADLLASLTHP
jgi:hypothetical protein